MALLAGLRESTLYVVRIGRALEILHMARSAIGGRAHKLPIDVALRAGHVHVRAGERELGERVVVERGRVPRRSVVTALTGLGKARLHVRWIAGLVEVRQVAADAGGRSPGIFSADVASGAVQGGVRSSERKAGELEMVELGAHPVVHAVALRTGRRKVQRHMARSRGLEFLGVAAVAIGRHRGEVAQRAVLMAGIAIDRGVRSQQREAVVMLLDLLDLDVPALYRVTLLAPGSQFSFVNVGVAIGALFAHVSENRFGVALDAGDALVQPAQREARGVVIKFWNCADRLPAVQRVTVLAWHTERTVWTARGDC